MCTITLQEAQANLVEIVGRLEPGEEMLILRDNEPVAKLVGEKRAASGPRVPGRQKHQILHIADDFDAPLNDFQEYME
jgi:antitoxin (DNA-binding transcriptional repressor) of toxin-antitoxin stability system